MLNFPQGLPLQKRFSKNPGAKAGLAPDDIRALPTAPEPVHISCIDYGPEQHELTGILNVEEFLAKHRPPWAAVRWINVDGLSDMTVIEALAKKYDLHPLAIEDLLHHPQRPKVDYYGGSGSEHQARLFIIARMVELVNNRLEQDQISIFLGHTTILTFQQKPGDVWDPIRQRIRASGSRLRTNNASFLAYELLDAIVDHCFPILERYGDLLEEIEQEVLSNPGRSMIAKIHRVKRELMILRRALWPMRDVLSTLAREPHECLSDTTRTYLRDVQDHTVQVIDIIETYREFGTGLTETQMTIMSTRLNEIMKVLTIISVVFIPVTFLSSVFGMNFEHFPWKWPYAFHAFVVSCLLTCGGMLIWFRRRGWL